jgi:MFS family permease
VWLRFPTGYFFGRLGDKIGRRKVFMIVILTFSLATGLMALTPERGWIFLTIMRFIVGLGVFRGRHAPAAGVHAGVQARLDQRGRR